MFFGAKRHAVGSAPYGVLWTGRVSLDVSSIRCFTVMMQPRHPSHIFSNSDSSCRNVFVFLVLVPESDLIYRVIRGPRLIFLSDVFTVWHLSSLSGCFDGEQG